MSEFWLLAAVDADIWRFLLDILLLLTVALVLGSLAERLRQSAIVGYLFAGTIVGPSALGWVANQQQVMGIAELGVALLLFTIGLEFSPRRLLSLGKVPLLVGPFQVVATMAAGIAVAMLLGLPVSEAIVIGAIIALSSTACVLRLLSDRTELDTPHGRISLGVLLVQDIAVVPLMLIVSVVAAGGTLREIVWQLGVSLFMAAVLIGGFYAVFTYAVPRLLLLPSLRRNRDLPVLLAVVVAFGAAWIAHYAELSPALGAFVSGVLLAISPFATQIRADIQPIKTVLVTLFFASVGMFADLEWLLNHFVLVGAVVVALVATKAAIVAGLVWICGRSPQFGIASGLCLAQVGEFSFVLATIAHANGADGRLLSDTSFQLLVTATIVTLVLTPYLVATAPTIGMRAMRLARRTRTTPSMTPTHPGTGGDHLSLDAASTAPFVLIVGFGPAGQSVAEEILARQSQGTSQYRLVVIDLNPENLGVARQYGLSSQLGDAAQIEVLEHAGIEKASLIVLTIPSPSTARHLILLARQLAPGVPIVARCRYHIHHWQLVHAGAHVIIDEEVQVGQAIARAVDDQLSMPPPADDAATAE